MKRVKRGEAAKSRAIEQRAIVEQREEERMAITRWEPFGSEWPRHWPERWRRWFDLDTTADRWLRVEELKEDGSLVVRAELPGVDPDKDVEIRLTDGMLHIAAKREERTEHKEKGSYRSEFTYGEFSRDIPLPKGVEKQAVKANYKDGILEVRMPWSAKTEEATATKVSVTKG
jgi:HSP20 family protein